jgi:RNA polymerase sigma-70 factor (ECF subfamily)
MIDVRRFRRGDPEYFEEVLRSHGHTVLAVAEAFGKDSDHAEDLFQETWSHVFEKRRSYRGTGSFDGWLHRIATRVCIGDYRDRKDRLEAMDRMRIENHREVLGVVPMDPLSAAARTDLHGRLHRALGGLSRREHEAITLRIFEGMSTDEVADRMRISQATVRSIVRHGIARLRNVMEDMGDELPGYRPSH